MILFAAGAAMLIAGAAYLSHQGGGSYGPQPSKQQDTGGAVEPGFSVYSLKELSRTDDGDSTLIRFSTAGLPFEFESLLFGDYSADPEIGGTYYAGSGMVLNMTGPSGTVTLSEPAGKVIHVVQYDGQPSVVFNGETICTSAPKASTRYEGTDLLIQDWLNGTWYPQQGVILERPTGTTIEESLFFLMVFQPSATVPEFGLFPTAPALAAAIFLMLARGRRARQRPA